MVSLVSVAVPPATSGTTYPSGMATLKGLISRNVAPLVAHIGHFPLGPLEELVLDRQVVGVDLPSCQSSSEK